MHSLTVPSLEGERIRLEPLGLEHSQGMFSLWREPEVCRHSGPAVDAEARPIDLPAASADESNRLIDFWLDRARSGSGFRWAVIHRDEDCFTGAVGFNALGECAEYAYHFVPRFWGAGLAAEASRLAFWWAASTGVSSIEAFIEAGNERSIRLAERLGFRATPRPEGRPPRYLMQLATPTR